MGPSTLSAGPIKSTPGAELARANAPQSCDVFTRFDPNNFINPTTIDNRWFPLIPGTQLILEGSADRGSGSRPHRVIFTVSDVTKVIKGVRTVVIWDRDLDDGELTEGELAFFAQDKDGNVWNFGEYPEEYQGWQKYGNPNTWITECRTGESGGTFAGNPLARKSAYMEGSSPNIEFLDCAKVFKMNQGVCVSGICYKDVIITDEWSPLDPESGHQLKYYAPGVGIVQVAAVEDPEAETLYSSK